MENRKATVPVLLLIVSWVVWIAVTRFRAWGKRKALIAQHACRAPTSPPYSDPFGLRELRESTKAYQSKTLIERGCAKHELYGTTYTSRFLTQKVIHTIEPENIKAVLSTNFDDYGVGWRRKHAFRPLLGDSLFQVDGHAWTKSRAVLQPVFNWVRVSDVDAWEEIVEHFLENVMEAAAGKQTVDLAPYCFTLATNLATSFVRGKSTIKASQAEKQEEQEFLDAMKHAGGGCEKRWQLGVFTFLFPMKEFRGHIRTIQRYIEKQVDEILAVRDTAKMDARRDGLASLTEQTTDKRVLRDEAAMLFVAAADTTGCLLTNLFFLLGRHPVMWTKLREEAKAFGDEKPTAQELKKLKYHKNCIQEGKLHIEVRKMVEGARLTAWHSSAVVPCTS
jgi:cytochrome P450